MPFYRRLGSLQSAQRLAVHLIVVSPDDKRSTDFLLNSRHVEIDSVSDVPLKTVFADGTPTALLVNGQGEVMRVWNGELDKDGQNELVSLITKEERQ